MQGNIKRTLDEIVENIEEFYGKVFGLYYKPNIKVVEVLLGLPYEQIHFNRRAGEIIVSQDFLDYFEYSLTVRSSNAIYMLSLLARDTLLQIFHNNKKYIENYSYGHRYGEIAIADTLGAIHYYLGELYHKENKREIRKYTKNKYDPYLFLRILNKNIIMGFQDKQKLKYVESKIKERLLNKRVSFVIKNVDINDFLNDVKEVLLNPRKTGEISGFYGYGILLSRRRSKY